MVARGQVAGRLLWGMVLAMPALAAPPAPEPITSPPAVQIVAFFVPEAGYQTTVAYSQAVPRETALRDLTILANRLGYESVDQLRRSRPDGGEPLPLALDEAGGGLTVGFRLSERAFNRDVGTFKLAPFIEAYRAYGRIDLDFVVGPLDGRSFAYRGVGNWDSRQVRLRHHGRGTAHAFVVEVLDPDLRELALPPFAPPALPLQADGSVGRSAPAWYELAMVGAASAVVGLLAFLVLYGGLRRWQGANKRRRARR